MVGALAGLPGIIAVEAFYPEKKARVEFDPELLGIDRIVLTLSQAGYFVTLNGPMIPPIAFPTLAIHEPSAFSPDELVCYCFGFTRAAIEQDYFQNGRSLILEKIAAEKKAGGCDCAHKNPKGR